MKKIILSTLLLIAFSFTQAQKTFTNKEGSKYKFTTVKDIEATDVMSQNRSSTCWSYSSLSFFESELIRMGKPEVKLAPMYIVRKAYEDKVEKYVRMHGKINLAAGGAFHDTKYVWDKYGIIPLELDSSDEITGDPNPVHGELDAMIKATADVIMAAKNNKKLSNVWKDAIDGILDAYFGDEPKEFEYKGKKYTPKSYAASLGLNMDDYIAITSYTHHPFYSQFALEVPDNWMWGTCHNIPLNEMQEVLDNALSNGYGVAWAADVSEDGFNWREGLALEPAADMGNKGSDEWKNAFNSPVKQKTITQELRQEAFDNYTTQDDHGMHLTGMVKDQQGNVYYKVKNSWGSYDGNSCGGYLYASREYVLYKTTNILVHKDAIPDAIAKKMGIKK
jgi:bleomycin hydrolase